MAPLIKDFLLSISTFNHRAAPSPSVAEWWRTVSLYTDQTGANISRSVILAGEYSDHLYSHGTHLTRLSIQEVIATAVCSKPFLVDHKNGIYLILTSVDVTMQDFCRAVCGFHYFTFPSMVGYTLPYAWVGNSGKQCPEVCAYPFAVPGYMGGGWSRGAEPARPLSIACCAYILHFNRVSLDIKDLQNKTMTIIARNE
ncbi:Protein EXORDIUM-like 5 [Forsythia ovata]|uniref:Protein EXORDIUM-like 5 n=1 Tax=Forsythia ovata TaxID=205694 RepID=A0ABD1WY79_9LAMI